MVITSKIRKTSQSAVKIRLDILLPVSMLSDTVL